MAFLALPAAAEEEQYAATIAVVGGIGSGSTASVDIWIDKFSTDEEAVELAVMLAEKGQDALRLAMEKLDVGRMSIDNEGVIPIAVARSLSGSGKRIVRLYIARNIYFLEHFEMTRTRDYPFSIIEMHVDEKGNGEGMAVAAAKLRFDDQAKQFVVESFGQGTNLKLVNVRRW
jgi:hypothetical protein